MTQTLVSFLLSRQVGSCVEHDSTSRIELINKYPLWKGEDTTQGYKTSVSFLLSRQVGSCVEHDSTSRIELIYKYPLWKGEDTAQGYNFQRKVAICLNSLMAMAHSWVVNIYNETALFTHMLVVAKPITMWMKIFNKAQWIW